MTAPEVRAEYENLQTVIRRFVTASEKTQNTLQTLERSASRLRESWQGRASTAFQSEMSATLLPAVRRLATALQQAGQTTTRIQSTIHTAEEEAARLFQGKSDGGTGFNEAGGGPMLVQYKQDGGDSPAPINPDDDPSLLLDSYDGIGVANPANTTPPDASLVDQILDFELPMWLELGLGVLVVGDILDLVREQLLKRLAGREPDNLITALAGFGLLAELGHLLPTPGIEDGANVALAALKTIARNLPSGPARDRLAEIVEAAMENPDELAKLARLAEAFGGNTELFGRLLDNPNALHAVLNGGTDTFDILARHGDDAMRAANNLAGNAPRFLQYFDDLAGVPGADNILRDLGSTSRTTVVGAMGELEYFSSIRGSLSQVGLIDPATGRKAADALLTDGTVIDVKNWNLYNPFYSDPTNIARTVESVSAQVTRYRELYPNAPAIRYVFNQPQAAMNPTLLRRLQDLGVEVVFTR